MSGRDLLAGWLVALALAVAQAAPAATPHVNLAVIDGMINPAVADYVRESIEASRADGASALILQLDTPGGLLDSTRDMVQDILGAPLPIVVYVAPSGAGAISAGVFITIAGHVAAMAPGTNIGAAHPVGGGGESIPGELGKKVENFAASLSRTIAQHRGRNVDWAEKAVRESVSATESEALKLGVIDLVAADLPDLLRQIDGREVEVANAKRTIAVRDARVVRLEMRLKQKVLNILANPNVAYLLMMAGVLGLYVEFTHPGVFFPGVLGGICLLLGLTALQVLPINYGGLALILLGIALLVAELFLPTFGIVGVGGMIAFVLGSLLLFDTPESTVAVEPAIVFAAAATLGVFTLIVATLVVRAHRRKPALGREGMIGEIGDVRVAIGPGSRSGKVFVHGEYWNAQADEPIEAGARVQVVAVDGMRLKVRRAS